MGSKREQNLKVDLVKISSRRCVWQKLFSNLITTGGREEKEMSDIAEDDKGSEASPKPSQLTPFSIADILSRRTSCAERRASESEEAQGATSFTRKPHQREYECSESENRECQLEDRNQMARFSRLPSPDLSVARELDILTRNLVHANISNFGTIPHLAQGTFKHLENLGNMGGYQPVKDSREALQRQQDEALDMSKNKYLGECCDNL